MPNILIEYELVIRDAANLTDAITISSVRGDTLPWLEGPPTCDGQEINPLTGEYRSGSYTGTIVDGITSGTSRAVTSQLEDSTFRQQLMGRVAYSKFRINGGSWTVLGAGFLTLLRLVSAARWEYTISDATRVEENAVAFSPKKGALALTANASGGATSLTVAALPFAICKNFVLYFLSGKTATVSAAAAQGATTVSVSALGSSLSSGDSAPVTESFASYFARWPNRGCLFGGPITNGFLGVPDMNGWIVKAIENTSVGGVDAASGTTFLAPLLGYVPPTLKPTIYVNDLAGIPNDAASALKGTMYGPTPGFQYEFESFWPGLVYQIVAVTGAFTGAVGEFYAPEDAAGFSSGVSMNGKGTNGIVDTNAKSRRHGLFAMTQSLSNGTNYRIRGLTCLPTEQSPLYWTGHPIDLVTALLDEQNRSYDATSVTTVRQAIGADRRISIRITTLPKVNDILRNAVYAPFGIGVRMNSSGVLEFFTMRILNNSPPSTTITAADIIDDKNGDTGIQAWFELDESTAIRTVTFEYDYFYLLQAAPKFPPDGVGSQHFRIENTNGDPGAVGQGVAAFVVPGMVHTKSSNIYSAPQLAIDPTIQSYVNQLTYEIFNRWGRGALTGELPFLRGGNGDTLKLGDECLNQVPQLPNKNKRYGDDNTVGARAMQIVRLTPTPRGNLVKLIDSGPNANAFGTLPTLTIAAAPGRRAVRFAQVTVTNASTLDAVPAGLEIQMAVTTGSTPASTDYAGVGQLGYGQIPTGVITLPGVLNGSTVWVRARTTAYGSRPSAWTTPISVALTAIAAPSSLSVTPNAGNGTQATAAFTPGANADQCAIDVYVWVTANGQPTAQRVDILPPTSVQASLQRLVPNTAYTCGVQSRDESTGDLSTMTTATFTTANVTPSLSIPLTPQFFTGSIDPVTGVQVVDGSYGMAVSATAFPALVEFFEAVETSVGSGTYGSFNSIGKVPSVQGDWTKIVRSAPNDGLRRQLQAQHAYDNSTSSSSTATGTVSPWGTAALLPKTAPAFTFNRWRCRVAKSGIQSIASGSTTAVTFNLEDFDIGGLHDTVTNPSRITIPTGGGGRLWIFSGIVGWSNNADTTQRLISIYKNGLVLVDGVRVAAVNGNTTSMALTWNDIPADTDYYELMVWQNSGGAINIDISTKFSAVDVW